MPDASGSLRCRVHDVSSLDDLQASGLTLHEFIKTPFAIEKVIKWRKEHPLCDEYGQYNAKFVFGWLKRVVNKIPDGLISPEMQELLKKLRIFGVSDDVYSAFAMRESSRERVLIKMADLFKAIIEQQVIVEDQPPVTGANVSVVYPMTAYLVPKIVGTTPQEINDFLMAHTKSLLEWTDLYSDLVFSGIFDKESTVEYSIEFASLKGSAESLVGNWALEGLTQERCLYMV